LLIHFLFRKNFHYFRNFSGKLFLQNARINFREIFPKLLKRKFSFQPYLGLFEYAFKFA
jgi:hypothetical protein